jgi:hypothetical protein
MTPWETDIQLPNISCAKCTLQVIQFMAETGDLKAPLPGPERFVDLQYLRAAGIQ